MLLMRTYLSYLCCTIFLFSPAVSFADNEGTELVVNEGDPPLTLYPPEVDAAGGDWQVEGFYDKGVIEILKDGTCYGRRCLVVAPRGSGKSSLVMHYQDGTDTVSTYRFSISVDSKVVDTEGHGGGEVKDTNAQKQVEDENKPISFAEQLKSGNLDSKKRSPIPFPTTPPKLSARAPEGLTDNHDGSSSTHLWKRLYVYAKHQDWHRVLALVSVLKEREGENISSESDEWVERDPLWKWELEGLENLSKQNTTNSTHSDKLYTVLKGLYYPKLMKEIDGYSENSLSSFDNKLFIRVVRLLESCCADRDSEMLDKLLTAYAAAFPLPLNEASGHPTEGDRLEMLLALAKNYGRRNEYISAREVLDSVLGGGKVLPEKVLSRKIVGALHLYNFDKKLFARAISEKARILKAESRYREAHQILSLLVDPLLISDRRVRDGARERSEKIRRYYLDYR